MTAPPLLLRCPECSHERVLGFSEKVSLLRGQGQLRREKEPTAELIDALFAGLLPRLPCRHCGATGLQPGTLEAEEDEAFWGAARRCEGCQQPIPPERLEVFPDTPFCTACQARGGTSAAADERDFCPRCGTPMTMALRRSGRTGFQSRCPSCGHRG